MKNRQIELPPLSFRAAIASADDTNRTVDVTWSTGAAVLRQDWNGNKFLEVLSLVPSHIRLDRLNSGAPLLNSHAASSIEDVIGTVEENSARVVNGEAIARVRFSRRPSVEPVWTDVRDGILCNLSVGYRTYAFRETAGKDGALPTRLAVDWEPFELSLVPMGADAGAGVREAGRGEANLCSIVDAIDLDAAETRSAEPGPPRALPAGDVERLVRLEVAKRRDDLERLVHLQVARLRMDLEEFVTGEVMRQLALDPATRPAALLATGMRISTDGARLR